MDHDHWMKRAIEIARAGIRAGQSPFGAVVVRDGGEVAAAHNEVYLRNDPTAHAEVVAIQRAADVLGTIALRGCTLYTTCEPCPMCAAAAHWAKVDAIVFGAAIADASRAGFSELRLSAESLYRQAGSPVRVVGPVLSEPCAALFDEWLAAGLVPPY